MRVRSHLSLVLACCVATGCIPTMTLANGTHLAKSLTAPPSVVRDRLRLTEIEAIAEMNRATAAYFAHGLHALATADLAAFAPEDRTRVVNAMARATVETGPKMAELPEIPSTDGLPEGSPGLAFAAAGRAAREVASLMMLELDHRVSFRGDAADAASESARSLSRMEGVMAPHSGGLVYAPFAPGPVGHELTRLIDVRRTALSEIVATAPHSDTDTGSLAAVAAATETAILPAERVLLSMSLDRLLASDQTPLREQAELIRAQAMLMCAEGGIRTLMRLAEDQGSSLTKEHMVRIASISLGSLSALMAAPSGERANASR